MPNVLGIIPAAEESNPSMRPGLIDVESETAGSGQYWAALRSIGGEDIIRCCAIREGDAELHLSVPPVCPLALGQRYEVSLEFGQAGDRECEVLLDGQYATVIRTERPARAPGGEMRVGLRFDHPLMF